jgi:hypothetical protein
VPEFALISDQRDRRNAVYPVSEWFDQAGHVEDFERARHDRDRLGVLRLSRLALDDPKAQRTARAHLARRGRLARHPRLKYHYRSWFFA